MIIKVICDEEDIKKIGEEIKNTTSKTFCGSFSINEDDLTNMKHIINISTKGECVLLRIDTKINNRSISWAG